MPLRRAANHLESVFVYNEIPNAKKSTAPAARRLLSLRVGGNDIMRQFEAMEIILPENKKMKEGNTKEVHALVFVMASDEPTADGDRAGDDKICRDRQFHDRGADRPVRLVADNQTAVAEEQAEDAPP